MPWVRESGSLLLPDVFRNLTLQKGKHLGLTTGKDPIFGSAFQPFIHSPDQSLVTLTYAASTAMGPSINLLCALVKVWCQVSYLKLLNMHMSRCFKSGCLHKYVLYVFILTYVSRWASKFGIVHASQWQ